MDTCFDKLSPADMGADRDWDVVDDGYPIQSPPANLVSVRLFDERGSTDQVSLIGLTKDADSIVVGEAVFMSEVEFAELRRKLRWLSRRVDEGYVQVGAYRFDYWVEA